MPTENETRRAAPDLEKEALSIAAHTMQQAAEELRAELRAAYQEIAGLRAELGKMIQSQEPGEEADLKRAYRAAKAESEQYLDYLRATHQLPSFGYWIKRRNELRKQEEQQKKSA